MSLARQANTDLTPLHQEAANHGGWLVSTIYVNNLQHLEWKCKNPDHPIFKSPWTSISQGHWCRKCGNEAIADQRRDHIDNLRARAIQLGGQLLSPSYRHGNDYYEWKCKFPLHASFYAKWYGVKYFYQWCPHCTRTFTAGERKIMDILDELKIRYSVQYIHSAFKSARRYDFYLLDYGIIIEYDGRQHFEHMHYFKRTMEQFLYQRHVDRLKTRIAMTYHKLIRIDYENYTHIKRHIVDGMKHCQTDSLYLSNIEMYSWLGEFIPDDIVVREVQAKYLMPVVAPVLAPAPAPPVNVN